MQETIMHLNCYQKQAEVIAEKIIENQVQKEKSFQIGQKEENKINKIQQNNDFNLTSGREQQQHQDKQEMGETSKNSQNNQNLNIQPYFDEDKYYQEDEEDQGGSELPQFLKDEQTQSTKKNLGVTEHLERAISLEILEYYKEQTEEYIQVAKKSFCFYSYLKIIQYYVDNRELKKALVIFAECMNDMENCGIQNWQDNL
ncbi:hypothetical protein PPERSA_07622 [Pseudocohnilembus persalinus]|uniref:Uncharacterized protein n=1 Tax=Pseudocohnilembus persalinus TaxID=266149 RepID=A0A0V0QID9_PSEPJ|nr:hypothetical protein PPERSA_07622 [Pseudocohnilembus persalinus]|eukprot:KRX01977.1 hypothetical protein PPERSA_07622 [Pseudocohnilembus persalinus]